MRVKLARVFALRDRRSLKFGRGAACGKPGPSPLHLQGLPPRLMPHKTFNGAWAHCNLARGAPRVFAPSLFGGVLHPEAIGDPASLPVVFRNAHPRPLGIHFHILWYRPKPITTKIHSLSMLKIQLECKILKHSIPQQPHTILPTL